jgi:hypothetical protein
LNRARWENTSTVIVMNRPTLWGERKGMYLVPLSATTFG